MARNSISYSFLTGESLWRSGNPLAAASACAGDPLGDPSRFLLPSSAGFVTGQILVVDGGITC